MPKVQDTFSTAKWAVRHMVSQSYFKQRNIFPNASISHQLLTVYTDSEMEDAM